LPERAKLRRLMDRVGQLGPRPGREELDGRQPASERDPALRPGPADDRTSEMDRQSQIEILLDHFNNPRNKKKLESPDVDLPGGNPGCGDVVRIYLKGDDGADPQRVGEVAFEGSGCTISQAAASILMEMMNADRPPLDEILAMDFEDMVDVLGRETVSSRPR